MSKSWNAWDNYSFINTVKEKHKEKENLIFDKVNIGTMQSYVTVTCKIHGDYQYKAYQLLNNNFQCKFCNKKDRHDKLAKKYYDKFIEKAKEKWPNIDYSITTLPKQEDRYRKYKIICPIHGEQEIIDKTFLKCGCPKCDNGINTGKCVNRNYTNEEFINELKNIYGNKYDYSEVNYINWKTKIKLKCDKHGWFYREPARLIHDVRGCPYCNKSLLENDFQKFLDEHGINYIREYSPPFLEKKRLDFYLPKFNVAIECQGRQHFYQNSIYNTKEKIEDIIERDKKKYLTCIENGLTVYYITYVNYNKEYFTILYKDKEMLFNKILENHE